MSKFIQPQMLWNRYQMIVFVSIQQLATEQTPRGHLWVNYICASVNSYERPTSLNHSYHLHESR